MCARCVRDVCAFCHQKEGGGRARSAHQTTDQSAGDCAAERGRAPPPTLRHGCGRGCAGRSGRTEAGAPTRAERSMNREGAYHPPPDSEQRERRGGGTGGRGQGARPTSGGNGHYNTTAGAAHPTNGRGGQTSARARGASHRKASGTNNERRRAWRAGARATPQKAPSLWREERTRGGTQRPQVSTARARSRPRAPQPAARIAATRRASPP